MAEKTQPDLLIKIWLHKRNKYLSNKIFRGIVLAVTGQESTKYLSEAEALAVLKRLEMIKPGKPAGRKPEDQPRWATDEQNKYIADLGEKLGFTEKSLNMFLFNMFRSPLRMLSPSKASRAIEALRAMDERGYRTWHREA
jgi:hypothetical protein